MTDVPIDQSIRLSRNLILAGSCFGLMAALNAGWLLHLTAIHKKAAAGSPFAVALIYMPVLLAVFIFRRSRIARFLTWAWALVGAFRAVTLVLHAAQGRAETLPWIYWDVSLTLVAGALLATPSARTDVVRFHSTRPSRIRMLLTGRRGRPAVK